MKIEDRLTKLAEDGMITPDAVEAAKEKGWITAKQATALDKKIDDSMVKHLDRLTDVAIEKGIIESRR